MKILKNRQVEVEVTQLAYEEILENRLVGIEDNEVKFFTFLSKPQKN